MILNLYNNSIFTSPTTSFSSLQTLANSLFPVSTNFELVRIGKNSDGGYLVPNDFDNIAACFSPGVEQNSSFEIDLLSKTGIQSHLADLSVSAPPSNFKPKSFTQKYLGAVNNSTHFTLDKWMEEQDELAHNKDLLLQMDIEGDEYLSILSINEELLSKFRIIIIEMHHIECWSNPLIFNFVEAFFNKILKNFHVVHNHPNNHGKLLNLNGFIAPQFMEITFLRKDRSPPIGYCREFPHSLDRPCFSGNPELILPINWHYNA